LRQGKDKNQNCARAGARAGGDHRQQGAFPRKSGAEHARIGGVEMSAAGAVDMILRAIIREKRAGRPAAWCIGSSTCWRGAPNGKKRSAFHIDKNGAENHDSGIAHDLDRMRGCGHTRGRRLEDEGTDSDDRNRTQALQERRTKGDHETAPQGALIGKHIGSNHRLAVTGARRMENPIAET